MKKNISKYLISSNVPLCPELIALQTNHVFDLWEAWEEESKEKQNTPFWSVVWPGAAALARFLLDNPNFVKGKQVLDLGCGGGIAAIAAAIAGARSVIANDIDKTSLSIAQINADANNANITLDNENLLYKTIVEPPQILLAADMFYEKKLAELTINLFKRLRKRGTVILIADGERKFTPTTDIITLFETNVPVIEELENVISRSVKVFSYLG